MRRVRRTRHTRDWLESCKKTITERGDTSAGAAPEWYPVQTKVSGAEARFTEVSWIPAGDESGSGYFESVGLALVGDRLAVTVSLVYGQDYNVAYDQDGDPDTRTAVAPAVWAADRRRRPADPVAAFRKSRACSFTLAASRISEPTGGSEV